MYLHFVLLQPYPGLIKFLVYFFCFTAIICGRVIGQQTSLQQFKAATSQPGFLKNCGQVRDVDNNPVDFVFYQANLGGQQVFVTNYGLSILLTRIKSIRNEAPVQASNAKRRTPSTDSFQVANLEMERIDIVLKNATIIPGNITTRVSSQSTPFNFYFDNYDAKNQQVRLQNEIIIKNVYPGIDWKLYIKEEAGKGAYLKYDFIVHQGANPSLIQLRYSDNAKIELADDEINARSKMGSIKEEKPYSYLSETGSAVKVQYRVKKNTISFETEKYSTSNTLIIDPSIFWLTYLSSSGNVFSFQSTSGNDVETDAAGNIFVQLSAATFAHFPTLNPGGGAYYQDQNSSPNGAMVICKFSPAGQMLWSTYFGNGVRGRIMTRDMSGNIYAIGSTYDGIPSDPNPNPSIPLLNNGGFFNGTRMTNFITKFSNSGVLLWSSYYCNFSSYPIDMTYDNNGNIYVTGWSEVWDFPVVDPGGGAYVVTNSQFGAAQVLFISQFNTGNQLVWSTRIEGNDYDPYARICTDRLGNIYLGGQTRSTNYPLVNAGGYYDESRWGSVITRFNTSRQMTWSTYYPGPFALSDITTDKNNNLYVVMDQRIIKFDANTQFVFEKSVATTRMHFWEKIVYDERHNQLQILGVMNDGYSGFPTLNTACNGSFYNNGISPHTWNNATGPIFATIGTDGNFSYRSLVDWVPENYDYSEIAVDPNGDMIYLFGDQRNGFGHPNAQLTNPGNGAYFDPQCCYQSSSLSSLLLKLTTSELSVDLQATPASGCNCDGTATTVPQCGQPGFNYLWSNGATAATVSDLCPGNYWVRATDANNLSRTVYFEIPYPPGSMTAVTKTVRPENCDRANGLIIINSVNGGSSPYTYSLDGINYSSSPQFSGLTSDRYIVHIKDVNGCIFYDTSNLQRVAGPSVMAFNTQRSSCVANDGQLQVTGVTGGVGPYQYSLNAGTPNTTGIFTALAANTYQLIVTDAAGCPFSRPITIERATAPTDAVFVSGNDHCNQNIGRVQVNTVTGGMGPYTYSVDSISFINGVVDNLSSGSYKLYIRDVNGCVLTKNPVMITNEDGPASASMVLDNAYCGKTTGAVRVNTVQGGVTPYTYSLDGGTYTTANNFTNIIPGTHRVSIQDAYGCVLTKDFELDFKPIATFDISPKDTIMCYGEMLSLKLAGELNRLHNINWSIPAEGSFAMLRINEDLQTITVSATDENNCPISEQAIVNAKACNPPEKCIAIPTAFTPNNDGKNDYAGPIINGCRIKSIRFQIYNRWGELVYETDRAGAGWNGIRNGVKQDSGVYVFLCDYTSDDGVTMQRRGTVTLIR